MPRRPRAFVDGATYHVVRRFAHGARVFAASEEVFELQAAAVEAELGRRLCMSGAILSLSTMPDLEVPNPVPFLGCDPRCLSAAFYLSDRRRWYSRPLPPCALRSSSRPITMMAHPNVVIPPGETKM